MSVNVISELSRTKLDELLSHRFETENLDFKHTLNPNETGKLADIAKDVIAMANTNGGHIVIGVRDGTFEVEGVDDEFARELKDGATVNQKLQRFCPRSITVHVAQHKVDVGGRQATVILFFIPPSDRLIVSTKDAQYGKEQKKTAFLHGEILVRKADQSTRMQSIQDLPPRLRPGAEEFLRETKATQRSIRWVIALGGISLVMTLTSILVYHRESKRPVVVSPPTGLQDTASKGGLISSPGSARDWYHNAGVYLKDGNRVMAEEAFGQYFALNKEPRYDPVLKYRRLLDANYPRVEVERIMKGLIERYPDQPAYQLAYLELIQGPEGIDGLKRFLDQHPRYLPVYRVLYDRTAGSTLSGELARSDLQVAFQANGGFDALKKLFLDPADGLAAGWLGTMERFGRGQRLNPMTRLILETQIDPDITLLWVGVREERPGRQIVLAFPNGTEVTAPLNNPANPALNSRHAPGVDSVARGNVVAFELPRYGNRNRIEFEPRAEDDVRIFRHYGALHGIRAGSETTFKVRYTDADGKTFHFPEPVTMTIGGAGAKNADRFFAATVKTPTGAGLLVGDYAPKLQIIPAEPMKSVFASAARSGEYLQVQRHKGIPTIFEIDLEDVPGFRFKAGPHILWVKGRTEGGLEVGPRTVEVTIAGAMKPKRPLVSSDAKHEPDSLTPLELRYINPADGGKSYKPEYYPDQVALSPDGSLLAVVFERGGLAVWDTARGQQVLSTPLTAKNLLAFSPDGKRLTTGFEEVALPAGTKSGKPDPSYDTIAVASAPDLSFLVIADRTRTVRVIEAKSRRLVCLISHAEGDRSFNKLMALLPSQNLVAVAGDWEKAVGLYDLRTAKRAKSLGEHSKGVVGLAASPDGKLLLTSDKARKVRLLDVTTGNDTAANVAVESYYPTVAFTLTGVPLIADVTEATIRVWDMATGKELALLQHGMGKRVKIALSADGSKAAASAKDRVLAWIPMQKKKPNILPDFCAIFRL
jgi:DNA-binding beta-propeller fold protein YncE